MTIITNKGTFFNFNDILKDMETEGYTTINIKKGYLFSNIGNLGTVGIVTKQEIEKILATT